VNTASSRQRKPSIKTQDLKSFLPSVDVIARDLYSIEFRNNVARCPHTGNHKNGDRDPSLRYDRRKNRIFCASQNCFGEKGADAFKLAQVMDNCSFPDALQTLNGRYGHQAPQLPGAAAIRAKSPNASSSSGDKQPVDDKQPVPAEKVRIAMKRKGYEAVSEYFYGDRVRRVRFDHESKRQKGKDRLEKTFKWEHSVDGVWYSGDGGLPKPLYVNRVFRESEQAGLALGFEGEAKADAAGDLGIPGFSFKDITNQQSSSLAGWDVVLWRDNDASGLQQARTAARVLKASSHIRSIRFIVPPEELAVAGDILDGIRELGWDRARIDQLIAAAEAHDPTQATGEEKSSFPGYFPFEVSDAGVFLLRKDADDEDERIFLAARVDVVAQTRDSSGNNWGRLITWRDNEQRIHQWAMPMELLASDTGAVRARLLGEGLPFITTNTRFRERLAEYLQRAPVHKRVLCVLRTGWHGTAYVLPDVAFGSKDGEEILYQPSDQSAHHWKVQGTTDNWRDHVGVFCSGNSRLVLAVSCAFAGPLLGLMDAESGGVHFYGTTSTGKTTTLIVGGSVAGGGGRSGFIQTWRATLNGLEGIAEAHNDATLFLDEFAQVDASEAAETAYLLANGQGKARMTRTMNVRKKLTWSLLFVSAGELTLTEHAASVGKKTKGGAEVRMLNIAADAGQEMGMFENLHGSSSAHEFVARPKDGAQHYYGSPLRAYLENLVRDREDVGRMVATVRKSMAGIVAKSAAGEVRRAADRFALIGAAGELATRWDLTGWREGEALEAAQRCFHEWLNARGTAGNSDVEKGISQVRSFLATEGNSRFQSIGRSSSGRASDDGDGQAVRNRAGFRRHNSETGEMEYLIFPETFRNEVCVGCNAQAIARELDKRKFLLRQDSSLMIKPHLPGLGKPRVYGIRAAILEEEDC
jgi:uncharacterized protein (DUF927 family)